MSEIHNLKDYKFAKQMIKEIPIAVGVLESCYTSLVPYRGFVSIANLLYDMEGAIVNLNINLPHYQKIVNSRGKNE